jgi:phosphoglycerate dehydrogenase-like enzyme
MKIALIDDYANAGLKSADWASLKGAEIKVFDWFLREEVAARELEPFDTIVTVRERMAFPASLFEKLPNLKLITTIGPPGANVDVAAATANGVLLCQAALSRGSYSHATAELTWGLMIAATRHFEFEQRRFRKGFWQKTAGNVLAGKTLALLGLGTIGSRMAHYAKAFDMNVIAWSQNLTADKAAEAGAKLVSKDELFSQGDFISIHVRLSDRTRGLVTSRELGMMKPSAFIVNTSRGPIIVERDLLDALRTNTIAGAALDTFDYEPLPADHHLRLLNNVIATPHLGFVTSETFERFYTGSLELVKAYGAGAPSGVVNPDALNHSKQKRS